MPYEKPQAFDGPHAEPPHAAHSGDTLTNGFKREHHIEMSPTTSKPPGAPKKRAFGSVKNRQKADSLFTKQIRRWRVTLVSDDMAIAP